VRIDKLGWDEKTTFYCLNNVGRFRSTQGCIR